MTPVARRRRGNGCLGAVLGLGVLLGVQVLLDSAFSSLPGRGWKLAAIGVVLVVCSTGTIVLVRRVQRQADQDAEERGWQRKGSIPMRQAPIVDDDRFVSGEAAKSELGCGQVTLNVLNMNGLDPCWSASGEPGFTRESVDAEAAYRRTASRARLFFRTLARSVG